MSNEEETEARKFLSWLPDQGVIGKILANLMEITTQVVGTDGKVAGKITENILLADTTLEIIDPTLFVGTEYYEWAITKHTDSVERIERRLMLFLQLGKRLLSMFGTFTALT